MIGGSLVAVVTPMLEGNAATTPVDYAALERLVEFHVDNGTDGIVAVGTTGESATLDMDEHCEVIRSVVALCRGRIPVVAGTGANSTSEAIELTRCAKAAGAEACLLVTPYYNKPTQEGLYRHFCAVAEAVEIPQIIYNVPGRTACDMTPATIARLSHVPGIVGVKEATGDLARVTELRADCRDGFLLFSGDDATARGFMLLGGDGVISVTANVAPRRMHDLCVVCRSGDRARAETLDISLFGLHRQLFAEANPIPSKWALAEMGLIQAGIRLPLTWLSESCRPRVREAMTRAGVTTGGG